MEELTHFNINHLKFFFDAATLGSVSKAARKNLVSQSAISQGIKSLEGALNCQLLEHRKSRFALTLKGEKVFIEAKSIMRSLVSLQQKVRHENHELNGHLYFGISNCLADTFLPEVYIQSQKMYPGLHLHARYGSVSSLKESLLKGSLEMILTFRPSILTDCQFIPVGSGFFRVYRSQDFRGSLKSSTLIIPESADVNIKEIGDQLISMYGDSAGVQPALPDWSMVLKLIQLGHGFGLLPDFIASGQKQGLQVVDGNSLKFPYEVGVIHPSGQQPTDYLMTFVELFRNNFLCNNVLV